MKLYQNLLIVLCVVSVGCETIPPEAATHAAALSEYQSKTARGTLAAYDKAVEGNAFLVEVLGGQIDALWQSYVDDVGMSANEMKAARTKLEMVEVLLSTGDEAQIKRALKLLRETAVAMEGVEQQLREYVSSATTTREEDREGIQAYKMQSKLVGDELWALIAENQAVVQGGITAHRELFDSYNMVVVARDGFFRGKLSALTQKVNDQAGEAFTKLQEKIDKYVGIVDLLMK